MHEKKIIKTFKELVDSDPIEAFKLGLLGDKILDILSNPEISLELIRDVVEVTKKGKKYTRELATLISKYMTSNGSIIVLDMVNSILNQMNKLYPKDILEISYTLGVYVSNQNGREY